MRTEQRYVIEKNKLQNRYLHGWGVVCGLKVKCFPYCTGHGSSGKVVVEPGYAIDCCGNDIVVCDEQEYDVVKRINELIKKKKAESDPCGPTVVVEETPCDKAEDKYRIDPVMLHKDKIYIKEHGDADIDVSDNYDRAIFDRSRPYYVKGTSVTFAIPFEGDPELFRCRPSSFTLSPPCAKIMTNELLMSYNEVDPDSEKIKSDFLSRVAEIESYLTNITRDITAFNNNLQHKAKEQIESRKTKILKDQGMIAELGYPIKEIPDTPKTYKAPEVKRKIVIQKPAATTTPFVPEPILDMENYEAILKIISDMVLVIERSPHVFANMKEEDLRQHFLVQLNGHFEGEATGETFNYEGRTDILIRSKDKNIFIAECMFWRGKKSLLDKIDQLLGYTSWRDTKTAILVFNKTKDLINVLSQIPEIVKTYKNFKRQLEYKCETGFRFVLHHIADRNRELILTILVFNIPQ